MAHQKEVFFLFILIMTQQSSSETDDAVIVHGQGTSCAETVHEVMEDAFADVTSEVKGRNVLQFLKVRPNFILFFPDKIQLYCDSSQDGDNGTNYRRSK